MTTKIANYSLKENAEMALYDLSMSFELQEGKRFKWRKSSQQLFLMVDEAFNSHTVDLVEKAIRFFKIIPYEIQHEFMSRRIQPPSEEQLKKRLYRGVHINSEENPTQASTTPANTLRYRGVAIDRSGNTQKKELPAAESKKVKRIWRGVVSYEDE